MRRTLVTAKQDFLRFLTAGEVYEQMDVHFKSATFTDGHIEIEKCIKTITKLNNGDWVELPKDYFI